MPSTHNQTFPAQIPQPYLVQKGVVPEHVQITSAPNIEVQNNPQEAQPAPCSTYQILRKSDMDRITTRLADDLDFQGDYTSCKANAGLSVAGSISGKVTLAENSVFVLLEGGNARACKVIATMVAIEGQFEGDINAEAIEIMPGANVAGSLIYKELRIHRGAVVTASHEMRA